ncbi:MAG: hypothetical protein BWX73_03358 [Lentisphaerae bacterium ADurb.Bin082]|nr:MAG: hypothetical protein BWX73_03358 [Lentisphaerae bacterium ADurb.Bin082]
MPDYRKQLNHWLESNRPFSAAVLLIYKQERGKR